MDRLVRILFFISAFVPGLIQAQPDSVSGSITADTVWTLTGSPVTVLQTVTIPSGVTLTIESGVSVKFDTNTALIVAGKIIADGVSFTSSKPEFVGTDVRSKTVLPAAPLVLYAAPGDWYGIEFKNSANVGSVFRNSSVKFGGAGPNAANIFYAIGAPGIELRDCFIAYSALHGVNTQTVSPLLHHSIITSNQGYGVFCDLFSNFTLDSCEISYNTIGGVRIPTNSAPSIFHSTINDNGIGIFIDNSAVPVIQGNIIQYNNIGIQFTGVGAGQPNISQNQIKFNSAWGFLNTSSSTTVLAENNYWGAQSGPNNSITNPTGLGNAVSSRVDFFPWQTLQANKVVKDISGTISGTLYPDTVYRAIANITVSSLLAILPGTTIKLNNNVYFYVSGTLQAVGTDDSLIVFTFDEDITYGGSVPSPVAGNWGRLEFNSASSNGSVLRNALVMYGGVGNVGNIYLNASSPSLSKIYTTNGSSYGLHAVNSSAVLDSITATGNANNGISVGSGVVRIWNSTMHGNGSRGLIASGSARVSVHFSQITNNSLDGIIVDGPSNATLDTLEYSLIANNGSNGVYNHLASGMQYIRFNRVEGNSGSGMWMDNVNTKILFEGDTLLNNGVDGIVSSKAEFLNNVFIGNNYPIGLTGTMGSTYSGNVFTNNLFNAISIRLYNLELSDTLKGTFPTGITTKSYVFVQNTSGDGIAVGATLVIEPGVIVKFGDGMYWNIDGTLIANGTASDPILFTSYRDSSYGGKTIAANDFAKPAPNDWRYLQMFSTSNNSQLNHCVFRYGGRDGIGMVYTNSVTFANQLKNLTFVRSSSYGLRMYRTVATLDTARVDSNASHGVYILGSNPGSDIIVRNSVIRYNGNSGLYADAGSAFREVSNCWIQYNAHHGIVVSDGQILQTYVNNLVQYNVIDGFHLYNPNLSVYDVQLIGNTISDNGSIGALTTASRYISNIIERNNYPLGVWGKLGNIYVNNSNVDGNSISQNTFNKAIAIVGSYLWDTIRTAFPAAMSSKTYHVIGDIAVNTGDTLVIEPDVKIKFVYLNSGTYSIDLDLYGTLIAEGTIGQPIIFTSWRDSTAGEKTSAVGDTTTPVRGDWNSILFRSGSGNSRVRHCEFRYGGDNGYQMVYFESNLSSLQFAQNSIQFSDANGIAVNNTALIFDSLYIADNDNTGLWLQNNTAVHAVIKNSVILRNGSHGIYKEGNAKLSLVDNCQIAMNNGEGIYATNNQVALTVSNSRIHQNTGHGIYNYTYNNLIDTLNLYVNNVIFNNGGTGIMSSRAYIVSDSIYGNKYGIGVTGQLSLAGTGTDLGNYYDGNVIQNNQRNSVIAVEYFVKGNLGYRFPQGLNPAVYAVRGDLELSSGDTLSIAPGTILKFAKDWGLSRFYVYGTLLSKGVENNKIVFTSWNDDTFGGDNNQDTTQPKPGDWSRMYIAGTASNATVVKNTIFRYGGLNGYSMVEVNSSNASIDSSYISFAGNTGLQLTHSNSMVLANEIHHNPTGIYINGTSNPVINYNNIYQNTYGIEAYLTNTIVNAENNYWGAASGPKKTTGPQDSLKNISGTGNQIYVSGTGDVDWKPYLTARQGILFGDVSGNGQISAFDASLVLQHDVNLITLNSVQKIAGNVNSDSLVDAFDASYILRYVVGLISGFPGLGKMSVETDAFSAFTFSIEKASEPGQFDLVISVNKPVNVFSASIGLQFDTLLLKPVTMSRGAASDSMSLVHHFPSGRANIALAGIYPLNTAGDIARFRFVLLDEGKAKESILFTVRKFFLNNMDVTAEAGNIILNVNDIVQLPTVFALEQNYPNPFNPTTTVNYQLPEAGNVNITIYNVLGQRVRTMMNGVQSPGYYSLQWNGTDDSGKPLSSGMYLYRMEAVTGAKQKFVNIKKMLLIK
ncbi:MAG: right-handed parallel beta-helix repeat-containing protein [Bacteroidetes bacterium]|nr:right-handed parallel beta-helix repeat-containing protein [Bacteroidota bacterium]